MTPKEKNLLWAGNMWYFGEGLLGPLFAVFAQKVGGNILDITWAWSVFLLVTGVSIIVVGMFAHRITRRKGREKLMVFGYALNALFTFGYVFVSTPTELLIVQAGLGLAVALSAPTWLALYSENSQGKKHDTYAWAMESGSQRLVVAVAVLCGGYVVTHYSFATLFLCMGCVQTLATHMVSTPGWTRALRSVSKR